MGMSRCNGGTMLKARMSHLLNEIENDNTQEEPRRVFSLTGYRVKKHFYGQNLEEKKNSSHKWEKID